MPCGPNADQATDSGCLPSGCGRLRRSDSGVAASLEGKSALLRDPRERSLVGSHAVTMAESLGDGLRRSTAGMCPWLGSDAAP